MPTDIPKLFSSLGLSESETKVYLGSLQLGPTSVQEIAKKARLSRTATYDAVASLQERGLLSTFERGKKKLFTAEDPERAAAYFKERVHQMTEELESFNRAMGEIKLMAGGERPTVRFYEGNEGLRTLFHDVAQLSPDKLDEVSNYEDIYDYLDESFLLEVREVLRPDKMRYRVLHRGVSRNPRPLVEYCQLLPEFGNFHGDIWIYKNRIAFVTFVGKIITVIVESEPFADTARVMFEAAWHVCATTGKVVKKQP